MDRNRVLHFNRQEFPSTEPQNLEDTLKEAKKVCAFEEEEEVVVAVRKALGGLELWRRS